MSLYTLDGRTRELLRLERFGAPDFSLKSFIEQLSDAQRHLDGERRLDPKPYIRTFEAAASELERLYDIAYTQEEAAADAAARENDQRNLEIQDVSGNVAICVSEMKNLDEMVAELHRRTGPVGSKFDLASHQHAQISAYKALVSAYIAILQGRSPSELLRLWTTDRRKYTQFVGQLQALATAIGPLEAHPEVQTKIDKFAEELENELVSKFQESYQNFDLSGMRETSDILAEFNGGGSVVQAYINQHRFFMNPELQPEAEQSKESKAMWEELSSPMSPIDQFEKVVDALVAEITDTVVRETDIIPKVFPKPALVLSVLVQRTFEQRVQGIVERYMTEAQDQPTTLAQVRVLCLCYTKINGMVNTLQKAWVAPTSRFSDAEKAELSSVIEAQFIDAFLFYMGDYFSLETKSLSEIINHELAAAVQHQSESNSSPASRPNGQQAEDGRMDRLMRAVRGLRMEDSPDPDGHRSSRDSHDMGVPSTNGEGGAALDRSGSISGSSNQSWQQLIAVPPSSLQTILAAFAEGIAREQILSPPERFPHDAIALFNLLMSEVGGRYISAILDGVIEHTARLDARNPVDWMFLRSIKTCGHALRLVSAFVKTVLFAMVQSTRKTQESMADTLNTYIATVQNSCRTVIEQTGDLMHSRTAAIFNRQAKRDFIEPPETGLINKAVLTELKQLAAVAHDNLSPENALRLLGLVSLTFCDDLLSHVSGYNISTAAGAALSSELNDYEKLMVHEWELGGDVAESFATLRAIAKLYTVDQALLPSLLRDSHLSRLKPNELRSYLSQRTDYNVKTMNMLYFNNYSSYRYRY